MPSDFDAPEAEEQDAPSSGMMDKPEGNEQEEMGSEMFLVNKTVYPNAQPGDTFTVRVDRVQEDELECSVVHEDENEAPEGMEEEAGAEPPADSMFA